MSLLDLRGAGWRHCVGIAVLSCCAVYLLAMGAGSAQGADGPERLWGSPESPVCPAGSGAGQCSIPRGMASDPVNGHLYVADNGNGRIDELTAWGEFVRAWGWDVVAPDSPNNDARNEIQEVTVDATSGTFKLSFNTGNGPKATAAIDFDAEATEVQAALEGLENIGTGDVAVSGPAGGPWMIEFKGNLADRDVLEIDSIDSTSGGTGVSIATVQQGASFEVCVPAQGDTCKAGSGGEEPGQFRSAVGVAIDSAGDVYVVDRNNFRVQKFSPEGEFLLMFGGDVNKTSGAEVCTKADLEGGDECGAGTTGTGPGQFVALDVGAYITVNTKESASAADDVIYVGESERIQEFDAEGKFIENLPDPEGVVVGNSVQSLAFDAVNHRLYVSFSGAKEALGLDASSGVVECQTKTTPGDQLDPRGIATGPQGEFYAIDGVKFFSTEMEVRKFDPQCAEVKDAEFPFSDGFDGSTGIATSAACGIEGIDLFLANSREDAYLRAYGPSPQDFDPPCEPPPEVPPGIEAQYAASVGSEGATVRAEINPRFWTDATYYLEYGTADCRNPGACEAKLLLPGADLGKGAGVSIATAPVAIEGLEPDTTYHYRFVAQSSGGGPAFGADPDGEGPGGASAEEGLGASFRTYPSPSVPPPCANDPFRLGAGAKLPDCRAYELVSPEDKEGGDIEVLLSANSEALARLEQAAADGGGLTYSSYRSFGGTQSAPYTSQYLARRTDGGWESEAISPPQEGTTFLGNDDLDSHYKAFSSDLCSGWVLQDTEPVLTPDALTGFSNLYRRDNCGAGTGSYEALTSTAHAPLAPPIPDNFVPMVKGFSADGSHAVFTAAGKLTSNANAATQLYESYDGGQLRLVCVLPGNPGPPYSGDCTAGTPEKAFPSANTDFRIDDVAQAVSADGSRIFWSDATDKLYVRIDGTQTVAVSPTGQAAFWGAAANGSKAIYTLGSLDTGDGQLREFDVIGKATSTIADEAWGVMGMSADASRIYLASGEICSSEPNSAGNLPVAGEPNLYLYEAGESCGAGELDFVGTLGQEEIDFSQLFTALHIWPYKRTARVSPDGLHATFISAQRLTGYDNVDLASGEADAEVFLYDAGAKEIACVSCNPSGARPAGRDIGRKGKFWAAAQIPGWPYQSHASRVLSDDGGRLFFESSDALVLSDTNEITDVYEWEQADGAAECRDLGAELYAPASGGCLSPISSGRSPSGSRFVDASADGSDVFFTTTSSLLPQDPGLVDIYDARAGGGFAPDDPPPGVCEGESCQSPPVAPDEPTPASEGFAGRGNIQPAKPCPRGKHKARRKGKAHCVRKHSHRKGHRARPHGRAGR